MAILGRVGDMFLDQIDNLGYRPHMLTDSRFHRGSDPKCLVYPREVVVHVA